MSLSDRPDGQAREAVPRVPHESGRGRRAYVSPELIDYGTVAKLTQSGSGSVADFFGMMRMMTCL